MLVFNDKISPKENNESNLEVDEVNYQFCYINNNSLVEPYWNSL